MNERREYVDPATFDPATRAVVRQQDATAAYGRVGEKIFRSKPGLYNITPSRLVNRRVLIFHVRSLRTSPPQQQRELLIAQRQKWANAKREFDALVAAYAMRWEERS